MNEELLLTPEEQMPIAFKARNETTSTPEYIDVLVQAIAKAQLAKAEPLIRKDERERIITEIKHWLRDDQPRLGDHYIAKIREARIKTMTIKEAMLVAAKDQRLTTSNAFPIWQALKEEK